jgi:hypothetical protein
MWTILIVVGIVLVSIVVFLRVPYSPTAARFYKITGERARDAENAEMFSEEDIRDLPLPIQNYFRHCGYLGTPKMSYMKASLTGVDFYMSKDRIVKIDYTQFNLVERPERFALISSSLYGIPFEGLDSYSNGVGSMKGVLAKVIPLFDQRGESMKRAGLVTWLAESPMLPAAMLQDFISWEEVDDTHVKATISWNGISAEGVFTFDESGAVASFQTVDRVATDMNGNEQLVAWSAIYDEYRPVNGILRPTVIQSVWHYPEGDLVYFNENKRPVSIECE